MIWFTIQEDANDCSFLVVVGAGGGQKAHFCSYHWVFIEYILFVSFLKVVFIGKLDCKMLRTTLWNFFLWLNVIVNTWDCKYLREVLKYNSHIMGNFYLKILINLFENGIQCKPV